MRRKTKLIVWLNVGILLALGPVWGVLGTALGMMRAFSHLAETSPDAGALADDISLALYTTAAGWIICPLGIAIIVIAAIKLGDG